MKTGIENFIAVSNQWTDFRHSLLHCDMFSFLLQYPHEYNEKTADLFNLQHYVIKEKKLNETEAVVIFFDIVRIVESLHKVRKTFIIFPSVASTLLPASPIVARFRFWM